MSVNLFEEKSLTSSNLAGNATATSREANVEVDRQDVAYLIP